MVYSRLRTRYTKKVKPPEYTTGVWRVRLQGRHIVVVDPTDHIIFALNTPQHYENLSAEALMNTLEWANASRIVECVNLSSGYSVKKLRILLAPKMPNSWYRLHRMRRCVEILLEALTRLLDDYKKLVKDNPDMEVQENAIDSIGSAREAIIEVTSRIDQIYSENWSLKNVRKE